MSQLLIHVKDLTNFIVDMAFVDANQQITSVRENLKLSDVTIENNDEVIIILPISCFALLNIPNIQVKKHLKQQAIAYALEDQLLQPIEELEFLSLPSAKDECSVAVIAKASWSALFEQLHENNIYPTRVAIDALIIPWQPNSWTLINWNSHVIIRTDSNAGFAIEANNLSIVLQRQLTEAKQKPERINVYSDIQEQNTLQEVMKVLNIPYEKHPIDNWFTLLRDGLVHSKLNILPHKYRPKVQGKLQKKLYFILGSLVIAWLGFTTLARAVEVLYLNHQLSQVEEKIIAEYKLIFPQANTVVNPQFRVQQKLNELKIGGNNAIFFELLNSAIKIPQQHPEIVIEKIEFKQNKLLLTLQNSSAKPLDFTTEFSNTGLQHSIKTQKNNSSISELTLWKN